MRLVRARPVRLQRAAPRGGAARHRRDPRKPRDRRRRLQRALARQTTSPLGRPLHDDKRSPRSRVNVALHAAARTAAIGLPRRLGGDARRWRAGRGATPTATSPVLDHRRARHRPRARRPPAPRVRSARKAADSCASTRADVTSSRAGATTNSQRAAGGTLLVKEIAHVGRGPQRSSSARSSAARSARAATGEFSTSG